MSADKRCTCSMAISFLGEGCRYCQPQEHITNLEQWLDAERSELERFTKEGEDNHDRAEEIIDAREIEIRRLQMEQQELWSANLRLAKHNNTLRKVLLSAQGRLNSPLNMVKCKGFGELMRKINETLKETEV